MKTISEEGAVRKTGQATMKALVFRGPGQKVMEERPVPTLLAPTDAIVEMRTTTICGTDLHILKGDVPEVEVGRILGHEGVGIVREVGDAVTEIKPGDRVLVSCITSCAKCEYCRKGMYSHCIRGGWILGHLIDGTQAEFVRIPFADTSLYRLPETLDDASAAMLSDIFPTGFECGVLNGKVKPGDTVAIVGAGPIGLAVLLTAQFFSPSQIIVVDVDNNRLALASSLGATAALNSSGVDVVKQMRDLTGGRGVDAAIEAVGVPPTFVLCEDIVAPGGTIANIGVHGKSVELHLERLWAANITITTRLVDTVTTPMLLKAVAAGKVHPKALVTHEFAHGQMLEAYDAFSRASETHAIKVAIAL